MRGLKPGVPGRIARKEPLLALMRAGLLAARNPRIALAYGTAFAARGDIAVVGTYLLLWSSQAAIEAGASNAKAAATAGALTGIVQGTALLWAGVFGWISTKLRRVTALAVAMALATAGYLGFGLLDDPNARASIGAACLLGVGQMSAILSSQVLIGQEAPQDTSGSVLGMYGFFGAAGILFISAIGGYLFDEWRRGAPFLIMAVANALLLVWTLWVLRTAPGPARAEAASS
jgi:MFS family permease